MIHLDDGVLRAYLDRELAAATADDVGRHLEACRHCDARVSELRRAESVVRAALAALDGPVPVEGAWNRIAIARRSGEAGGGTESAARRSGWPLARAAGWLILLGGGAAAALVPGSPLRSLWTADAPPAVTPDARPSALAESPGWAGVRTTASGGSVRVAIAAPAGTAVEVVVVAGERAGVFGPPAASFSTEDDLLRVETSEGPLRVEFPASLATGRIEVAGVTVVEVRDGELRTAPEGAITNDGEALLRFRLR